MTTNMRYYNRGINCAYSFIENNYTIMRSGKEVNIPIKKRWKEILNTANNYYLLIILGIFSFFNSSFSLEKSPYFGHLTTENGLSNNNIYCIAKDKYNFMWFGTEDGLNKYDAYKFTVYKNDPNNNKSISDNIITAIAASGSEIWIGTRNGLNKYNYQSDNFKQYYHNDTVMHSISDNYILSFLNDKMGRIWIGTANGLNLYDPKNDGFICYKYRPGDTLNLSNQIWSIAEDHEGNLLIGSNNGVYIFNSVSKEFSLLIEFTDQNSSSSFYCAIEDRKQNIWMGSLGGSGLFYFDRKTKRLINFTHNSKNPKSLSNNAILHLLEDDEGNLWISTNEGLSCIERETNIFQGQGIFKNYRYSAKEKNGLSSNMIKVTFVDNDNRLWIGERFGGINIFDKKKNRFSNYKFTDIDNRFMSNNMTAMVEDNNGNIWFGADEGGIYCWNKKNNKYQVFRNNYNDRTSLASNKVLALCIDSYDNLWVGMWGGGIDKMKIGTGIFKHYKNIPGDVTSLANNYVFNITEDRQHNIWVGLWTGGLNLYNSKHDNFIRYPFELNDSSSSAAVTVVNLFQDKMDNIWIGTELKGLSMLNTKKNVFRNYEFISGDSASVADNTINTIYEDTRNRIWIGTKRGLSVYKGEKDIFQSFNKNNELSDAMIYGILEDSKGNLWISTNNGVYRVSIIEDQNTLKLSYKKFDKYDGLQDNQFNRWSYLKTKKGEMIFGGINGINIFYPDSINENISIPPIIITDFTIFNKSVPIGGPNSPLKVHINETKEISLSYKQSLISFEYAILDYTNPEQNKYAYKLEGFEDDWNYIGNQRKVTYTNLEPGKYVFKVKGCNSDGYWNEKGTSIYITIVPPFWQTLWFRLLLLAALLGIIYLIYKWQMQARDLAAQKRLDSALTKERNLLRTIINNIPDPVYVKDTAGRKTIANLADVQNMGFSNDAEVLGKDDYAFFAKDIAEKFISDDKSVIEKGVSVINKEEYFKQANGDERWLLTTKIPLRNEENEIIGLVGVGRDITKRKEYEEYLQNDRNLLRTLIDNLPDYIYIKDNKGQFLVANTAVASQLGFKSPDELIGKSDYDLFPYELASQYFATEQKILTGGEGIFDYEGPTIDNSKEEKERWITTTKVPLYNAKGEIAGTIGLGRDITERRKTAAEREKLITQLQEAVADVKLLSGLVPICANCKKIRDDQGYWTQIESYIQDRSNAKFSHSICPECAKKIYPNYDIKF